MGKWCLHASSFIFDRIIIIVAGNQDRHKSSEEFDFMPLVSMAHLYVFEMRFDLGTLDSGERSLPFGLLVDQIIIKVPGTRTGIKAGSSSILGRIRPLILELLAFE